MLASLMDIARLRFDDDGVCRAGDADRLWRVGRRAQRVETEIYRCRCSAKGNTGRRIDDIACTARRRLQVTRRRGVANAIGWCVAVYRQRNIVGDGNTVECHTNIPALRNRHLLRVAQRSLHLVGKAARLKHVGIEKTRGDHGGKDADDDHRHDQFDQREAAIFIQSAYAACLCCAR